tara:strand:- start:571 stop:813 length:243 start_codon:yes stop_codon:yes gene_type:complete
MESYKTPEYQRRAYKKYLQKHKENSKFLEDRKKAQNNYYHRKRSKQLYELGKITEEEYNERMIKYGKKKKLVPIEDEVSE